MGRADTVAHDPSVADYRATSPETGEGISICDSPAPKGERNMSCVPSGVNHA